MTVLRHVCGSFLPDGTLCQGRVLVDREIGALIQGDCENCGACFAFPIAKAHPRIRRERNLERAHLPAKFIDKRLKEDEHNRPVLEALRSWLASFDAGDLSSGLPGPALWGAAGRGKTHTLVALCRKLITEKDLTVAWFSARSLLRELQGFDADAKAAWEGAVAVDVLALDDLGAQRQTDWRLDQLADLVDERYQHERPVVLATNYPPSAWPDMLDARTASRLRGMTFPVELRGSDRRQLAFPRAPEPARNPSSEETT